MVLFPQKMQMPLLVLGIGDAGLASPTNELNNL